MACVPAHNFEVVAKPHAYTRLEERLYLFKRLDGSGSHNDLHQHTPIQYADPHVPDADHQHIH